MSEFFYREADHVIGPISGATLKSLCQRGEISPATEIRKDDGTWTPAGQVKGLAELFTLETAKVVMVPHRQPTTDIDGKVARKQNSDADQSCLTQLLPGEEVLFQRRPLFWRGFPSHVLRVFFMAPLFGGIWSIFFTTLQAVELTGLLAVALCIGPLLMYLFFWRRMSFEVTSERTILVVRGVKGESFEVPHKEVKKVWVTQGWLQKRFGTGSLNLIHAAKPYTTLGIPGIDHPEIIAEEIRKRMGTS